MAKTYDIKEPVRGELRHSGEVVAFELDAGPVDAREVHPLVLKRLISKGHAVVAAKPAEKKEQKDE